MQTNLRAGDPCYLLTKRGPMPATFLRAYVAPGGAEVADVQAHTGRVYTAQQPNVLDVDAGRLMLLHKRAEGMAAEGYRAKLGYMAGQWLFRVYSPFKHGTAGGWRLRLLPSGALSCNCPVYTATGTCKHVAALPSLLHREAAAAEAAGLPLHATTYRSLAAMLVAAEQPAPQLSQPAPAPPVPCVSCGQRPGKPSFNGRCFYCERDLAFPA